MRLFILVFISIFIISCRAKYETYIGTVKDFSLLSKNFGSEPTIIIQLNNGDKITCELYKNISSGDSVWDGRIGIVWKSKYTN